VKVLRNIVREVLEAAHDPSNFEDPLDVSVRLRDVVAALRHEAVNNDPWRPHMAPADFIERMAREGKMLSGGMGGVSDHVVIERTGEFVRIAEAVPPTRRDVWAILRGTYRPEIRVVQRLTLAGFDAVLKDVWDDRIRQALDQPSAFEGHFERES
jgi:hypothetical protein